MVVEFLSLSLSLSNRQVDNRQVDNRQVDNRQVDNRQVEIIVALAIPIPI